MNGWYFSDKSETLRYDDGRKIAVGIKHTVDCKPVLCSAGLHASRTVRKALQYAPGPILWKVTLGGDVVHADDKSCGTERTYHARLDATDVLRAFARRCALDVIHLWDAPSVVRRYLETGDDSVRSATCAAAWAATSAAAANAAAGDDAARNAAKAAAWAAWYSADTAWSAAEAASRDADRAAAWAADRAADRAAEAAAGADAEAARSKMLDEMVEVAFAAQEAEQ